MGLVRHARMLMLALAVAFALMAPRPTLARADGGAGISIAPPPGGAIVAGASITATFSTDAALYGNNPLRVSFVASADGAATLTTYSIIATAGTTYTVQIAVPNLPLGQYTLVIAGQEIAGGKLISHPFVVVSPTPTPLPSPTSAATPIPPPVTSSDGDLPVGVIAAGSVVLLLAASLALLILPSLRRGRKPLSR
jgi:hypothetical protein